MTDVSLESRIDQLVEATAGADPRASHVRELEWLRELRNRRTVASNRSSNGTHTFAMLELSENSYREIFKKLSDAGYQDSFHVEGLETPVIDMHGIGISLEKVTTDRQMLVDVVDALKKLNKSKDTLDWGKLIKHVETHLYGEPNNQAKDDTNAAG